ncbi:thioredoxin fold domain-containing protein [Pontibacter sp. G13]|uniref:thioredoxin fold domain-containing protein n=1 Tax=Pontibacter sp. G13 TaxID=3074898 RepID=UPI00288A756E|nr:thioredoxin fold domain-containing protein [Pontibacter sp. G13]WNJ20374.1 thioredoxin fold domain-containing protein [Pontibacter sp. G13]
MLTHERFWALLGFVLILFPRSVWAQPDWKPYQGGLDGILAEAKSQALPAVIYVYTDWCEPCKQMETETLKDPRLKEWLGERSLFYGIDAEMKMRGSKDDLVKELNVDLFPTMFIFGADGELAFRMTGYWPAEALLDELAQLPDTQSESMGSQLPERSGTPTPSPEEPPAPDAPKEGYAIQMGAYESEKRASKESLRIGVKYDVPVFIQSYDQKGQEVFKVFIGPFPQKGQADSVKEHLKGDDRKGPWVTKVPE